MEAAGHVAATELVESANRRFERRATVAKDVERHTQARVDVAPLWHARDRIDVTRGNPQSGGQVRGREAHGDVVPSQTQVDRQALNLPGVLCEEADFVVLSFLLEERPREVLNPVRFAVQEIVVQAVGLVVVHPGFVVERLLVRDANLEVVTAGHVRQRETLGAPPGARDRRRERGGRAVAEAGRKFENRAVVAAHAGFREIDPVRDLPRGAGFQEQPAGQRRRPRALDHTGREPIPAAFRLDRIRTGEGTRGAAARLLDVSVETEPVAGRGLQRPPKGMVPVPVEARSRTTEVWRVPDRRRTGNSRLALEQVEVRIRLVDTRTPASHRGKEPELVLDDWTAKLRASPIDALHLCALGDTERLDGVVDIRGLHPVVRVKRVEAATERVAAALRNDVQRCAARA